MERYICIHGHFYQPPRENPWLEEVELQDSAYPYHDWNERVTAECYAPNTASRILDRDGRIIDIVTTYSKISFNFGPTLLSWMERHQPEVYHAILEADRLSMERFSGHGSAIAQVYNHMIMPLANRRDKYTQVLWGIRDFEKRFKRFPEGMWLPETAVDIETLEVLAELGIKFTILSQRQAKRIRRLTENEWLDVSGGTIDPTTPYILSLTSGKTVAIFFYDGRISHDVAFGELLTSGEVFAEKLVSAFTDQRDWPQIIHIATDGETYGHHHRFGDMALAYCLYDIENRNLAKITNYGEYLEKHPPGYEVEIYENSSWSCIHGIERWRDNCGCNSGMKPGWTQEWRKPLREAMDILRDMLIPLYSNKVSHYLRDPWDSRNDYIEIILDRSEEHIEEFFERHASRALSRREKGETLKLLEMQRNAMLMYTSCGWFFDEISGIESIQVMLYAAKAIQYLEEIGGMSLEQEFLKILEKAPSNVYEHEHGALTYEMFVKPAMLDLLRVCAHFAVSSLFEEYQEKTGIYCYSITTEKYERTEAGKLKLSMGKTHISSDITWDEALLSFAVLHFGDHNVNGGVIKFIQDEAFEKMQGEIRDAFDKSDIPEIIKLMVKHFGTNNYSLWHLFRDEQRKVLGQILDSTLREVETSFRQIYENSYSIMNFLRSLNIPLPKPFLVAAEYTVNTDLKRIFEEEEVNAEKLKNLIHEVKKWSLQVDTTTFGFVASARINSLLWELSQQPGDIELLNKIDTLVKELRKLPIELNIWRAQNIFFTISKSFYGSLRERAEQRDEFARRWVDVFHKVSDYFKVRVL